MSAEPDATVLVARLRMFAIGCRGSMWQSRDETIRLCDEAADVIEALRTHPPQPDALPGDLREALRLAQEGADKAGCDGWRAQEKCRQIAHILSLIQSERGGA